MRSIIAAAACFVLLGACRPAALPSAMPTPSPVSQPTLAPTSPPRIPTLDVDGVRVPDPRTTNPELLDANGDNIGQFVDAMNAIGLQLGPRDIVEQLTTSYRALPDVRGKKYVLSTYTVTDGNGTPYSVGIMAEQDAAGAWTWSPLTLKNIAGKQGIEVGTEGSGWLQGTPRSMELALAQVDTVRPDYPNYSWRNLQPSKDSKVDAQKLSDIIRQWRGYGFQNVILDKPLSNDDAAALPDWLTNGNYSYAELEAFVTNYITQVANIAAAEGVKVMQIATESHLPGFPRDDFFYSKLGSYDYIRWATLAAKKAQPGIKLLYSDTSNHAASGITTELTHEIIKQNPELDYVGAEGHLGDWVPYYEASDIETTLAGYSKPVMVMEMDVSLHGLPQTDMPALLAKQAQVGFEFINAAKTAGVKTFIFWGLDDNVSWLSAPQQFGGQGQEDAHATLFDANYQPRPLFYAVCAALLP